ncbi:MAG: DNA topoisomerase 4 subunit A [Clostridia bacterium]|nr:DNA topoisomerase 4 subunit A [Clostridia bacterium]
MMSRRENNIFRNILTLTRKIISLNMAKGSNWQNMDEEDEKELLPIDGQIELAEILVREDENTQKNDDEREKIEVAKGQISMLDNKNGEDMEKEKDKNKVKNAVKKVQKSASETKKNIKQVDNKSKLAQKTLKNAEKTADSIAKGFDDLREFLNKDARDEKKKAQEKQTPPKLQARHVIKREVSSDDILKILENDENAKIIDDVNNLNKDFEEVDKDVGKGVFSKYSNKKVFNTGAKNYEEKVYFENSGEDDGMMYKNLDTVLHESMMPYSEHVILDRALPRVEDGLKPVQRRILFSMLELGITPDKAYKKSARIVGNCLGKYHPHGDSSVYDAMVRMAQPFNCNETLVDGHGNFGSVDGDSAAAMRYTEARLTPLAMELLRDLDKNTVKWGLNFDDTLKEPEILPGRFPNLLVNGASGIAVGLATNIPPHNLEEVVDGVMAYIDNPNISLKQMMKIIKGPDFPTGGYVLSTSEITQAYETGRGRVFLRAKMHVEGLGTDKRCIVITEMPFQVNKSSLLQKIANFKDDDKYGFGDIAEIRDESDRKGQRAVIRLKKDANLSKIYKSLLQNTELQGTFGINMVAIAGGKPKQMGLIDIISYYSEYQREIIYRRTKYDLEQAKERAHILEGLIVAIKNIDAVIKIIKSSPNTLEAKKRLREKFLFDERQAQAILDMRLARLTSLEVQKLQEELAGLKKLIVELSEIVGSTKRQYEVVKTELNEIKKKFKNPRKTFFMKEEEIVLEEEKGEEDAKELTVLKTPLDNIKAVNSKQYRMLAKENFENATLNDIFLINLPTLSTATLLAMTNFGNCFKAPVSSLGESRLRDKGTPEWTIFKEMQKNERIVALFDESEMQNNGNLLFFTKFGMVKKTARQENSLLKKTYQVIKLKDGDELLSVEYEPEKTYSFVFVTKKGMVLNAKSDDVPVQGRVSSGVKGVSLSCEDCCVGVSTAISGEGEILCVSDKGFAKRVVVSQIDEMARYRKGIKILSGGVSGSEVKLGKVVNESGLLCIVDEENALHFKNTDLVSIEARTGKGKMLEKTNKNFSVKDSFLIV